MTGRKKLIEVALPLEAINREAAREKGNPFLKGHPRNLHQWWARRPLAACRAVLFAQLVDDPSSQPVEFPTEEAQEKERQRLFGILEELVKWENSTNKQVLEAARSEIRRSTGANLPQMFDPFCGGGSIPLEAQRLGLEAYAGDLNPVAVLIAKALIEIPSKFADKPPVHPEIDRKLLESEWVKSRGLAEDVVYYGQWMCNEAKKRIGYLYPKVRLPKDYGGGEATVIAWLWARTIASPNPVCGGTHVPLVKSFWLSSKKGKEVWINPLIDKSTNTYSFEIRKGKPVDATSIATGTRSGKKATFICLLSGVPITTDYIREEGRAGRLGVRLIAIVALGARSRVYIEPTSYHESIAFKANPSWIPDIELIDNPRYISPPLYGMKKQCDLFTSRQMIALSTFSNLMR